MWRRRRGREERGERRGGELEIGWERGGMERLDEGGQVSWSDGKGRRKDERMDEVPEAFRIATSQVRHGQH
jgi:hypothetical protein